MCIGQTLLEYYVLPIDFSARGRHTVCTCWVHLRAPWCHRLSPSDFGSLSETDGGHNPNSFHVTYALQSTDYTWPRPRNPSFNFLLRAVSLIALLMNKQSSTCVDGIPLIYFQEHSTLCSIRVLFFCLYLGFPI
jgi:hypothetical protein